MNWIHCSPSRSSLMSSLLQNSSGSTGAQQNSSSNFSSKFCWVTTTDWNSYSKRIKIESHITTLLHFSFTKSTIWRKRSSLMNFCHIKSFLSCTCCCMLLHFIGFWKLRESEMLYYLQLLRLLHHRIGIQHQFIILRDILIDFIARESWSLISERIYCLATCAY